MVSKKVADRILALRDLVKKEENLFVPEGISYHFIDYKIFREKG